MKFFEIISNIFKSKKTCTCSNFESKIETIEPKAQTQNSINISEKWVEEIKEVKEPKVKEPKVKEPKVKEPKVKEPKAKEPKAKESKAKAKTPKKGKK